MATYYGVNSTLYATPVPETFVHSRLSGSKTYCSTDWYFSPAGAEVAGSIVNCGKLPKGAVVSHTVIFPIDTASYGAADAMANAVTGTIGITDGTTSDADYLGTFTTLGVVTPQTLYPTPDGTVHELASTPLTYDADVYVTTADATIAATEGFAIKVYYTIA